MQHKRCCNESARITAVSTFGVENALIPPSKAMDKHCRAAIVCMMGMRKFGRCAMMAPVGKDAMLIIARLIWSAKCDAKWGMMKEESKKCGLNESLARYKKMKTCAIVAEPIASRGGARCG